MKGKLITSLLLLLGAPLVGSAERLIPAGSLISCTMSEPRFSSKTANIGDPVLCQVSHVELYGRSTLPYGSFMVGRFEDYKDPGHFVGKGWLELKFDHMVIQPDTVIPVSARVVNVPGYAVDREGRILGKGHPVRDIIEWSIPILWPIDLINLPRRGPRPTLREETRLTLKVMDDLGVPDPTPAPQQDSSGLWRRPSAYEPPPQQPEPQPISQAPPPPEPQAQPVQVQPVVYVQPVQTVYVPAPQPVYYPQYVYVMPPPPPPPMRMYYGPPVVYRRAYPYVVARPSY